MKEPVHLPLPNSSLIEWAIYYASLSYPIIPLYEPTSKKECSCYKKDCPSIGKHPRVKNGLKDATTDLATIRSWWAKWPNANIGIATGVVSKLIVIDVDVKNDGLSSLDQIQKMYGPMLGAKVRSGSGGLHFYFSMGVNDHIRNKVNLLPGIDIRGEGGYIVAPPSSHASGKSYSWESPCLEELCTPPDWLLKLIVPIQALSFDTTIAPLNKISPGSRNNFLASLAGALIKKQIDSCHLENILSLVNEKLCSPSLDPSEVANIAHSISKYASQGLIWKELIEIPDNSYDVPHLPESLIPLSLYEWIVDTAQRMQVPYEFIAVPALVGISSVIGRKFRIYPKKNDSWLVVPNLWGAIVSRPGTFKSPAIAEALRPLEQIVEKENNKFSKELNDWAIEKSIREATFEATKDQMIRSLKKDNLEEADLLKERLKKLQQEILQKAPSCKRLKTNDATIEKLIELFLENPNGLLLVRDELAGWLSSLNKSGREGDRELHIESWNGYGSYTVDRIGRGTVHVPSLCLSILGGIQPDKLKKLITNSLDTNDDGLLQRFQLLIYPEIKGKWKNHDVSPNIEAQKTVSKLIEKIHNFEVKEEIGFKGLRFDTQSQDLFNSWREQLEHSLRSGEIENIFFESHLSKYRSLVPSLALIFEILEKSISCSVISVESTQLAIQWSEYLLEHAKKVYQVSNYPHFASIQAFQKKLMAGKIRDGDTVRTVARHHWDHLGTTELLEKAIAFLCDYNWIQIIETPSNGRPTRTIKIHPDLLSSLI
jgi:putative DNA primase/helicase